MGFPNRLTRAAQRLQLRCPPAHRGLSTNAKRGDDWIYWKIFVASGMLGAISFEGLNMYLRKSSLPNKVSENANLEVQSSDRLENHVLRV